MPKILFQILSNICTPLHLVLIHFLKYYGSFLVLSLTYNIAILPTVLHPCLMSSINALTIILHHYLQQLSLTFTEKYSNIFSITIYLQCNMYSNSVVIQTFILTLLLLPNIQNYSLTITIACLTLSIKALLYILYTKIMGTLPSTLQSNL